MACDGETEDDRCQAVNHCVRDGDQVNCEEGYTREDPDDSDNFNCVSVGGDGDGAANQRPVAVYSRQRVLTYASVMKDRLVMRG